MILSFFDSIFDRNVNTSKANLEVIHFSKQFQTNSFYIEAETETEKESHFHSNVKTIKANWAQNKIAKLEAGAKIV